MAYIGKSPTGTGVRQRYYFTATGGETSLSGTDDNGLTLAFSDGNYVDVSLNGIALVAGTDYNTSTANTIGGLSALSASDIVEVVVYDIFTVADTVSAANGGTFSGNVTMNGDLTVDTNTLYVDSTNNLVGVGTSSPATELDVAGNATIGTNTSGVINVKGGSTTSSQVRFFDGGTGRARIGVPTGQTYLSLSGSDTLTADVAIDSSGNAYFLNQLRVVDAVGDDPAFLSATSDEGVELQSGHIVAVRDSGAIFQANRIGTDGQLFNFYAQGVLEGNITVSGSTVSYNGGHLARWSQLADNTRDESIVKGTVMTNLDQMAEWTNDGVTEDNEQLNCMAVSSVEGDANVAGVFVNWDNDDDIYTNDMNVAMTGDMVIRIAQGTAVARGDLLMSAGDGTAKPQGDDIVRSKTIAKVTSTHVSRTYDDGSYLVPCVLMAC